SQIELSDELRQQLSDRFAGVREGGSYLGAGNGAPKMTHGGPDFERIAQARSLHAAAHAQAEIKQGVHGGTAARRDSPHVRGRGRELRVLEGDPLEVGHRAHADAVARRSGGPVRRAVKSL